MLTKEDYQEESNSTMYRLESESTIIMWIDRRSSTISGNGNQPISARRIIQWGRTSKLLAMETSSRNLKECSTIEEKFDVIPEIEWNLSTLSFPVWQYKINFLNRDGLIVLQSNSSFSHWLILQLAFWCLNPTVVVFLRSSPPIGWFQANVILAVGVYFRLI